MFTSPKVDPNSDKAPIIFTIELADDVDLEKNPKKTNETQKSTHWPSVYISAAIAFIGSVQFSVFFTSMWPYLESVDPVATETFFGYIIGVYSLGQCIASPIFGLWSNRTMQTKIPVQLGMALMFMGSLMYMIVELFPDNRRYMMLLARFINGFGSGNISLVKAFCAISSIASDRPRAIAFVTGGIALGSTMGPAFQVLFTPIGPEGIPLFGGLRLNMYTAPAYFSCLMNAGGAIAIYFFFKEQYSGLHIVDQTDENMRRFQALPKCDMTAVLVCNLLRFTQMFVTTNLETIGSPFSRVVFGWTKAESVLYNSIAQGVQGLINFATYFLYIGFNLSGWLNFRLSCLLSLLAMLAFHVITYSFPFIPGNVPMFDGGNANETAEHIGCNIHRFDWCQDLRPVNVWVYLISYTVIIGLAFPLMNIALNTLYAQIIGPRKQGTLQGLFQMSGGSARMIGPIAMASLYANYGPRMSWNMEIIVCVGTVIVWLIFYRRAIPLRTLNQLPSGANVRSRFGPIYKL